MIFITPFHISGLSLGLLHLEVMGAKKNGAHEGDTRGAAPMTSNRLLRRLHLAKL